ncbi:hypothetical protein J4440_00945 [Candidatus Woesearchaeota archaeon]|nr:hypothetical protein [Candidatus Woesearchaeota archaeon]
MNRNIIIVVALVVLVVIAGLQAFQLSGLKSELDSGEVKLKSASSSAGIASQGSGSPSSLDSLPQMVGGC